MQGSVFVALLAAAALSLVSAESTTRCYKYVRNYSSSPIIVDFVTLDKDGKIKKHDGSQASSASVRATQVALIKPGGASYRHYPYDDDHLLVLTKNGKKSHLYKVSDVPCLFTANIYDVDLTTPYDNEVTTEMSKEFSTKYCYKYLYNWSNSPVHYWTSTKSNGNDPLLMGYTSNRVYVPDVGDFRVYSLDGQRAVFPSSKWPCNSDMHLFGDTIETAAGDNALPMRNHGAAYKRADYDVGGEESDSCGTFEGCFLVNYFAQKENRLEIDGTLQYDVYSKNDLVSIRCDTRGDKIVEYKHTYQGEPDQVSVEETQESNTIWFIGDFDNLLARCGKKQVQVQGMNEEGVPCFSETYDLTANCVDK